MGGLRKKSIAMWATAFMVLSVVGVFGTAAADEGGAAGRISTKAPQWKANDYWHYSFSQRTVHWSVNVDFGTGTLGSATFDGKQDFYELRDTNDLTDPTYYKVNHVWERWENGTYKFTYQGQTSTTANYKLWDKWATTSPEKVRKTDLATGDYNGQRDSTERYDEIPQWGKLYDWTDTSAHVVTHSTPITWYQFPMDISKPNWQVTGVETDHLTRTLTRVDDGAYMNVDATVISTYDTMMGTIQTEKETQNCPPVGTFTDCYKLWTRGSYSWTETGTATQPGFPDTPINENGQQYLEQWQWYSNTAGYIVNYNQTAQDKGYLLTSRQYTPIPPNFKPEMRTLAGQQFVSGMTIPVKEKDPVAIDFGVYDEDGGDTVNWTVVSVTGAVTNPQGAKLMDDLPTFAMATTTGDDQSHLHSNRLTITAKQPKTIERDTYTIKINASDGNEGGSTVFEFKVVVYNVNDKPYVAMPIPDITMRENSTMVCTTWKMTDIFKDPDREAGILEDRLTYTAVVTAGPSFGISIDNDTGTVSFSVPDYAWEGVPPTTWDSNIKFTVTDSGSGTAANKTSNTTTAKMHIEHVNHDPGLSANGTDLEENGLTWAEDVVDSRLDLNKAFSDPDVRYADDVLTFTFSGQKNIGVKNNAGRMTMTPTKDWNGKETIKFKATDKFGRSKELRLEVTVAQVPDAPFFCETEMDITWQDTEALTIKEANTPAGPLNKLLLAVSIKDADELMGAVDPHSCQWYINDSQGNVIYKTNKFSQGDDDYEFKAAWVGAFSASGSPYEVKCIAKDTFGLVTTYIWNVTVINMNRPPTVKVDGPMDNKSFMKDSKIHFDAWNSSDPDTDELRDNLTFIWNSSKQGTFHQDRGQNGAMFDFKNLKVGKHIITVTVQDSYGGETSLSFTVTVKDSTPTPGFEVVALIASIIVAVAVLGRRRK